MEIKIPLVPCVGEDESSVTPTHLKFSLDWRCDQPGGPSAKVTGFYISLYLDTMDQGRLNIVNDLLLMTGEPPKAVVGNSGPVPQNGSATVNIGMFDWHLMLVLEEVGTSSEYNVVISGTIDTHWIIGELDLDPTDPDNF